MLGSALFSFFFVSSTDFFVSSLDFRDFLVFSRSTFFRVLNLALLAFLCFLLGFRILCTFYGFSVAVRLCFGFLGLGAFLGLRFLLSAFFRGALLLFTILFFLSVF